MASYGDALAALDDFRADLAQEQMSTAVPQAQAMAFRAGAASGSPLADVHATGVGIRDDGNGHDFVIKVYVFNAGAVAQAAPALLSRAYQGIGVDVEQLPIQFALAKAAEKKEQAAKPKAAKPKAAKPKATAPGNHQAIHNPVPGGVEIAPLGGNFVGTLGCFVRRGTDPNGPLFVLSNNHVLADVNRFPLGRQFTQPFSANPARVLAALADFEPLQFPSGTTQPRNVIDAAIARVTGPARAATGRIFGIERYAPQLLAPRPGMAVIKSGRTTGVTRGTIRAIRVRGVQVNYGTQTNPIIATFDNAIQIAGPAGTSFSRPGDSGSAILDEATGRPVALLFAGDGVSTTACDITVACARFGVHPV